MYMLLEKKMKTIAENNSHVNVNICLKVAANVSSEQATRYFSRTFNEYHMIVAIMPIRNENLGSFLSHIFQEDILKR